MFLYIVYILTLLMKKGHRFKLFHGISLVLILKSLTVTSLPPFFILLPLQFSMADQPKFHPALTITNVKSLIPITLDAEHDMYHSWAALFKVLVRIHDLHHHIISPTEAQAYGGTGGSHLCRIQSRRPCSMEASRCRDASMYNNIVSNLVNSLH